LRLCPSRRGRHKGQCLPAFTATWEAGLCPELEWRTTGPIGADVFGNTLETLSINGTLILDAPDNRYLPGGRWVLWRTRKLGGCSFNLIAL
jgi:hypothetical protein